MPSMFLAMDYTGTATDDTPISTSIAPRNTPHISHHIGSRSGAMECIDGGSLFPEAIWCREDEDLDDTNCWWEERCTVNRRDTNPIDAGDQYDLCDSTNVRARIQEIISRFEAAGCASVGFVLPHHFEAPESDFADKNVIVDQIRSDIASFVGDDDYNDTGDIDWTCDALGQTTDDGVHLDADGEQFVRDCFRARSKVTMTATE